MTLTAHGAGAVAVSPRSRCPRSASPPARRCSTGPRSSGSAVGAPDEFHNDTYLPRVITEVAGIGQVGKTTIYVRACNPEIDAAPNPPGIDEQFIALSTRCMHLGCPVRFIAAAERFVCPCHGGVYDFTGKVDGGPPVRPLDRFYTRVRNGQVEVGRALLGQQRVPPLPVLPRPGAGSRRHRPVPLSRPLLHAQDGLAMKLPLPPLPAALQPKPKRPGEAEKVKPLDQAKEAGIATVDWIDERTSLSGGARWMMFRKVPKGTNWFYTLGSATHVRLPLAGRDRRLPGDVLRPVASRTRTSRRATSPTRSSSASSCAACTSGARR